jgi:N-methylhydantoinase A
MIPPTSFCPQYIGRYAAELGVSNILIPRLAPEFSALGAATSDLEATAEREIAPCRVQELAGTAASIFAELEETVCAELSTGPRAASRSGSSVELRRRIGLRFFRQLDRIDVTLALGEIRETDLARAEHEFRERYEHVVGRGTAHADAVVELVSVGVDGRIPLIQEVSMQCDGTMQEPVGHRLAWFDRQQTECPVYDWNNLRCGSTLAGPAFIESERTTAVIYPMHQARVDESANLWITVAP